MALEINSGCAHAHPRAFAIYKAELDSGKVTEKVCYASIVGAGLSYHARQGLVLGVAGSGEDGAG